MTVRVSTLANGLRVASHSMPHLGTVALGVWVASGARHEAPDEHGISHLLEHMAFKGTARRTARDIAEEIEQVGGDLNAATSLDTTFYYARVLKDDIAIALDLLADIVQNPLYDQAELEREREVILQEIAATRDSPDDLVYDLLQDAAYTGQALGRPILGTPESVSSFTSDHLRSFLASRYRAGRMVLSAAGNVDHDDLVRRAEELFGGLPTGVPGDAVPAHYVGGLRHSDRAFEQSHVLLGYQGLSFRDPDFYSAQVFSGLFGGGMSSRLFQEVREKRGLCYSIYSSAWGLSDAGLLSVHAATGEEEIQQLLGVLRDELRRAANELPSDRELQRAKAQIKTGILMSYESSVSRAEQMARQLLAFDRLVATDDLIGRVEAVSGEAVRDVARRMLTGSPLSFAIVGAGPSGKDVSARALESLSI
ncbi:MAG TPA: pitrilysin family protein [Hyphomicrobiaceae bacterium]|nr:pitrilysin family protein [Hyphomicrobiaceae bacterium]